VQFETRAVGVTAGSRKVPGIKPVKSDNDNNIIVIIVTIYSISAKQ
jgi:hypothetical protein